MAAYGLEQVWACSTGMDAHLRISVATSLHGLPKSPKAIPGQCGWHAYGKEALSTSLCAVSALARCNASVRMTVLSTAMHAPLFVMKPATSGHWAPRV